MMAEDATPLVEALLAAFITRVLDPHPPATSVGGCGGDSSVVSLKSAPIIETRSEGALWKARSQALSIL
jgi:hypothetical protein